MRVQWTYHGRVSSEVDSSGIPVGLSKEKKGIIAEKILPGCKCKLTPIRLFISITVVGVS